MVTGEPLLVIVGPTGVGKTAVAVRLAARVPMEAVSADSRQIYRGMDIGTGKPTASEQAAVRHHLIDIVEPDERYHVARFRVEALGAVAAIRSRGALPVVVGGTGLYVRALLKGLDEAPPADLALREQLEHDASQQGMGVLHARLAALDPTAAARLHPHDRIRVIRALEIALVTGRPGATGRDGAPVEPRAGGWAASVPPFRLLMIGLRQDREALNRRLAERVRGMVAQGLMDEVRRLVAAGFPPALPAMGGIGYRHFAAVLAGRLDEADAVRLMVRDTTRYAKRQMTWFARDPEIRWVDIDGAGGVEGAADTIFKDLAQEGLVG
jgi:tRNA dimethylallyltransferase